ncbi:hypothetical protein BC830DRAFT_1146149 [Chytriomyces sp. MP71]|nr:hypothetical protein BC830DRAFT_1146149 [Chytriomyces sp. MP71]
MSISKQHLTKYSPLEGAINSTLLPEKRAARREDRRLIAFIASLFVALVPTILLLIAAFNTLLPNGPQAKITLLPYQQQLVPIHSQILKSAVFNANAPGNIRAHLFVAEPEVLPTFQTTYQIADFSVVSLGRASEVYTTFAFHILKGGNLIINTTLPESAAVSLQVVLLPETGFVNTSERFPVFLPTLPPTSSIYINATHTGKYIVNFIRDKEAPAASEEDDCHEGLGAIEIISRTPLYNTAKAFKICDVESCEMTPARFAVFEHVPTCHDSVSNALNLARAMEAIAATPMSFNYLQEVRVRALEGAGIVVGEYLAKTCAVLYLSVMLAVSVVVPLVLIAVIGPIFGFSVTDLWMKEAHCYAAV